jgi:hypothetical protein
LAHHPLAVSHPNAEQLLAFPNQPLLEIPLALQVNYVSVNVYIRQMNTSVLADIRIDFCASAKIGKEFHWPDGISAPAR